MKRALVFALLLGACGSESATETAAETESATDPATDPATEPAPEPAPEPEPDADPASVALLPITESAAPARFYLYAGSPSAITEGSSDSDSFAFLVRMGAGGDGEGFYGNEPAYARLEAVAERVQEIAAEEERRHPGDYSVDHLAVAGAAACVRGDGIPEPLRVGAPIDLLGSDGWTRSSITGCTSFSHGHNFYFAFNVERAPDDAMLAAIPADARPAASFRTLPTRLPALRASALERFSTEATRVGVAVSLEGIEPPHTGSFELPNGRTLVHLGFPFTYDGDEDPPDPGFTREECGSYGGCGPSGLVLYDARGDRSQALHGTAHEVDGGLGEGGSWQVVAVFRDGPTVGVVTRYVDIGHEQVVLTRFSARMRPTRQQLYYFVGG